MPTPKPIVLDENCPPRRLLALFAVKWTSMVLESLHLHGGCCRTGVLHRSLPGVSKKMLTQTLREMERDGLIARKVYPVVPPMVEYSLTPAGQRFTTLLDLLKAWGEANADVLKGLARRRNNAVVPRKAT
ncbi:MAG: putative transcriptional regulator [Phycisphaerales bacterium]|nr:putative transcriptional regulator [Phycisphaerales bacterium]